MCIYVHSTPFIKYNIPSRCYSESLAFLNVSGTAEVVAPFFFFSLFILFFPSVDSQVKKKRDRGTRRDTLQEEKSYRGKKIKLVCDSTLTCIYTHSCISLRFLYVFYLRCVVSCKETIENFI